MTITRSDVEKELVRRARKKMDLVEMAVTTEGTNDDLSGPMAYALRAVGITPASPITVEDSDLVNLLDENLDEFLDRAELRLFENIEGNIDLTDIQVGPRREALGQLAEQIKDLLKTKREAISTKYGDGVSSLEVGSIMLDFAQKHDDRFSS